MNARTALVVDDSKSARFAMRRFLESFGYQVDTAESAEDAYGKLRSARPQVMFLDHIMPGTDGFGAIRAIREDSSLAQLPIVLCSSNDGEEFRRQARACGAIDVLSKPPAAEQIKAVLDNLSRLPAREPVQIAAPALQLEEMDPPGGPLPATVPWQEPVPEAQPMNVATPPPAPQPEWEPRKTLPRIGAESLRAGNEDFSARMESIRNDVDARMRKITQDLYLQLGQLAATVAHIDAAQQPRDDAALEQRLFAAMAAMIESLQVPQLLAKVELQFETLTQRVDAQLASLRAELQGSLQAQQQEQARRLDEMELRLRQLAAEEAEVATTTAGIRISTQLADAIAGALRHPTT